MSDFAAYVNLMLNLLTAVWLIGLSAVVWRDQVRGRGSRAAQTALLTRQVQDSATQTGLLQKIYHLQSKALRPGIEADQRQRIIEALAQSGLYDTREARDSLAEACPAKLRDTLARNNMPLLDLRQIITRAARWDDDCLLTVLDQAIYDLNGSAAGKELRAIRAELAPSPNY